jgi:hypothetical protein
VGHAILKVYFYRNLEVSKSLEYKSYFARQTAAIFSSMLPKQHRFGK